MPNNLIYSGLPVLLIGLNYWHDKKAQNMFIVFLLFHQLLSVLLLALPYGQLAVLAATNYDPGGIDLTGINIEFTGEIARYGEQERVYAQHDNPNTYGLFSIISLAVGFYLISKKTVSCRISSIILIITSFIGVLLTMSRASIFGLLVGSIIVLIRNTRIFRKKESICIAIIAVIFSLYILLNYTVNIIESFEIKDIDMRIDALQVGIEVIKNNPLFGANLAFEWPDNIPPHQIMIYFAAMYGLFAGLLITLLYIISFFAILLKRPNIELCILFGFVCIFTGLANNFAAPILYWLCFSYSLIPIAMSIKINPIKIMPPNFYMQTR